MKHSQSLKSLSPVNNLGSSPVPQFKNSKDPDHPMILLRLPVPIQVDRMIFCTVDIEHISHYHTYSKIWYFVKSRRKDTVPGEATLFFIPFFKGVCSKRKEFAPSGKAVGLQDSKWKVTKVVSLVKWQKIYQVYPVSSVM